MLDPFPTLREATVHHQAVGSSLSLRCSVPECYPPGTVYWGENRNGPKLRPIETTERIALDYEGRPSCNTVKACGRPTVVEHYVRKTGKKIGSDSVLNNRTAQEVDIRSDCFSAETACNLQSKLKLTNLTLLAFTLQIKNVLKHDLNRVFMHSSFNTAVSLQPLLFVNYSTLT